MSLRKILIGLGILVALLPYIGLPSRIDTILYTLAGLMIVFLLTIWKKGRMDNEVGEEKEGTLSQQKNESKTLQVKHGETEDHSLHGEKEVPTEKES